MGGFGEFKEFSEQVFRLVELNHQAAGLKADTGREVRHLPVECIRADRQHDLGARPQAARLVDHFREPLFTMHLILEARVPVNPLELGNEMKTVDEKGPAGLEAAEPVAEADRLAALQGEEFFDEGPVDDRRLQYLQLTDNLRK